MKKADPDAVVDDFEVDVVQLLADWLAIDNALASERVSFSWCALPPTPCFAWQSTGRPLYPTGGSRPSTAIPVPL